MNSQLVFPPPPHAEQAPLLALDPYVNLYLRSRSQDAQVARERINNWYAAFPAQSATFLARLRNRDDNIHFSAVDELFIHFLLRRRYQLAYEEQTAVAKPTDFRLYVSGELVGSLEVLSLFVQQDWSGDLQRNGMLHDALNQALPLGSWYIGFQVYQWNPRRQPSLKPIINWVRDQMESLPQPSPEPPAAFQYRQYRDDRQGVRIEFSFIQRISARSPQPCDRIVASPGTIGGFGGAIQRLRAALDKKVTKRYDLQGKPFAIVVSNHDFACDSSDIQQSVYGDGGFFAPQADGRIRNTRVSAIYVLHRWAPWHHQPAQILELPNPNAQNPMRESIFPASAPILASTIRA